MANIFNSLYTKWPTFNTLYTKWPTFNSLYTKRPAYSIAYVQNGQINQGREHATRDWRLI